MRHVLTKFANPIRKFATAAAVIAVLLASGVSAQAASREEGETIQPLNQLKTEGVKRPPRSSVEKVGDTLVVDCVGGPHTVYLIGVEGNPGAMTVHFDNWAMQFYDDVANIDVNFQGGANKLYVYQVNVPGNVDVSAGDGDNQFFLGLPAYDPNFFGGDFLANVGNGTNWFRVEESWVFGDASILAGDGGNNFLFGKADSPSDLGAVVLGDLNISSGDDDDIVEITKCWMGGNVGIETNGGGDAIILGTNYENGSPIAGNVFNANVTLATGEGDDAIGMTDNTVHGDTLITMSQDDDELLIGDAPAFPANQFNGAFEAHGGSGTDAVNDDPGNSYAFAPEFFGFELP